MNLRMSFSLGKYSGREGNRLNRATVIYARPRPKVPPGSSLTLFPLLYPALPLLYTGMFTSMQSRYPIGILGATGMVGQRFIQLLENHPWFEIAWLAASDRSSGKKYADAAKWRLDTPLPERIARMTVSPAEPEGAPKIIFAALDADIARDMEPKF